MGEPSRAICPNFLRFRTAGEAFDATAPALNQIERLEEERLTFRVQTLARVVFVLSPGLRRVAFLPQLAAEPDLPASIAALIFATSMSVRRATIAAMIEPAAETTAATTAEARTTDQSTASSSVTQASTWPTEIWIRQSGCRRSFCGPSARRPPRAVSWPCQVRLSTHDEP